MCACFFSAHPKCLKVDGTQPGTTVRKYVALTGSSGSMV